MPLPPDFEVASYRYTFRSWPPDPNIPGDERLDTISLLDAADRVKAVLKFQRDPGPLPANNSNGAFYVAYFWHSEMPAIIDMLRNEKPLTFQFGMSLQGLNRSALFTGKPEPVGEGERA